MALPNRSNAPVGSVGGWVYHARLWALLRSGQIVLFEPSPADTDRIMELMDRYSNVPMSLADASIVVAAEKESKKTVFTLDSHFRIYRLRDGSVLDVVP